MTKEERESTIQMDDLSQSRLSTMSTATVDLIEVSENKLNKKQRDDEKIAQIEEKMLKDNSAEAKLGRKKMLIRAA